MNKMKFKKEMHVVFGILFVFGMVLIVAKGTLDSVYSQTNSTMNQTSTPPTTNTNTTTTTTTPAITTSAEEEATESIKGAITESGSFLRNVTEKISTSKSAGAILNETSEVLGNAYVDAKKFFSLN